MFNREITVKPRTSKIIYGAGARGEYDAIMAKFWPFDRKKFIEDLEIKVGDKVLDVAVGTGLNLPYYPEGADVIGMDSCKKMLDEARKKKTKARVGLRQADIYSLFQYPKDYFDFVVSTFTLSVVEDCYTAVDALMNTVKPGGILAFFDYCVSNNPDVRKWQYMMRYHTAKIGFPQKRIVWNSLTDYDGVKSHAENSGLQLWHDAENVTEVYERHENENPFLTCCRLIVRKREK